MAKWVLPDPKNAPVPSKPKITQEDVDAFFQTKEPKATKLIVVETQQFFEIKIPDHIDPECFVQSDMCKQICADKILDKTTDLILERAYDKYNPDTESWSD